MYRKHLSTTNYILSICNKTSIYTLLLTGIFTFLLIQPTLTLAQQPEVTITEVFVDFDSGLIEIVGQNFDLGPDALTVTLGSFGSLNIITEQADLIVVEFPEGGLPTGDYLLKVSSGPGQRKNDQRTITIGAQGPQGDQGDQGDQGQQGQQGPIGPDGPQGPIGPVGPMGAIGPAGAQGIQGIQGEQGMTGMTGMTGPQGPPGPGEFLIFSGGSLGNVGNGGTRYLSMVHDARGFPAENNAEFTVTEAGTLTNLRVDLNNQPGNGTRSYTFTVRVNNASPALGLSCPITTGLFTCVDNARCIDVAAGDEIALQSVPSVGPTPAQRQVGLRTIFRPGDTCGP